MTIQKHIYWTEHSHELEMYVCVGDREEVRGHREREQEQEEGERKREERGESGRVAE